MHAGTIGRRGSILAVLVSMSLPTGPGRTQERPAEAEPWEDVFSLPVGRAGGMAYDGRRLWVVDREARELVGIDPASGQATDRLPAPGPWPEGLAWDGERLWVSDAETRMVYGLHPASGLVDRRFESPVETPQGLAFDGEELWIADGSRLHRISREDGTTIVSLPAPTHGAGRPTEMLGLAWQPAGRGRPGNSLPRGTLWVTDRHRDRVFRVSPERGEVIDRIPTPGPYPVGATFVDGRLWVADRDLRRIHRLDPAALPAVVRTDGVDREVVFVHELQNLGPAPLRSADVFLALPQDGPGQTLAGEPVFDPAPTEILTDVWGQRVARFHRDGLPAGETARVRMTVRVSTGAVRRHIDPDRVGGLSAIPAEIRNRYTRDGSKFRIRDPVIREAVEEAIGDERNPYWMMRRIARTVADRLEYELAGGWNVAPAVLTRGTGSCSEYTFVFLAMCRAAGLAARYVGAVVVRGDDASTDRVFHRWPEVYLPGYGWVQADAQAADKVSPEDQAGSLLESENRFLVTTQGGGGSEVLGWSYNYDANWSCEGTCQVEQRVWGDWSADRGDPPAASTEAGE